ncbi:nitroreductase family protein [Roseiconus lacunae]|uniref:nitroreductase family protein n=1 Tax=Roseiconus lacunae TaxID=2605694 RepID=UPI0030883826|nr:nitroreductase family protein [Stieleria sp. HD01]
MTINDQNRDDFAAVKRTIEKRKTLKVLGDLGSPVEINTTVAQNNDASIREALRTAGMAPFHYDRAIDSIAEPWRAHLLFHRNCRQVAELLEQWTPPGLSAGKLPAMFSACGAAILVTWLPQFRSGSESKPEQIDVDDEHLAAASAMVQNLLLLLTAKGMGTYWSSGGVLKQTGVSAHLGVNEGEKLLAVVFVEYPETQTLEIDRKPGKHRDSRSDGWIREVVL